MTAKETTSIRAPNWQLMFVDPEQKTLTPLSNVDVKTLEQINTYDLKKLFPAEKDSANDDNVAMNHLKEKLEKITEEKNKLDSNISKLKEDNLKLTEKLLRMKQVQTDNERSNISNRYQQPKYEYKPLAPKKESTDVPDFNDSFDYRASDIKHSSITDVVDAVVGLQR